eukprot:12014822-Alexandrium_andersonii.AAC.1
MAQSHLSGAHAFSDSIFGALIRPFSRCASRGAAEVAVECPWGPLGGPQGSLGGPLESLGRGVWVGLGQHPSGLERGH